MEREGPRRFSIEPYVDQGGILGTRLEVNQAAASSVMKRTALRRDVLVAKGAVKEKEQAVGSQELALVKSRSLFGEFLVSQKRSSSLAKRGDSWIIQVDDQDLHQGVDDWMSRHFVAKSEVSGHEVYQRRFTGRLNEEVAGRINNAFWEEKRFIFTRSIQGGSITGFVLLSYGALMYLFQDTMRYILVDVNPVTHADRLISFEEQLKLLGKVVLVSLSSSMAVGSARFLRLTIENIVQEPLLRKSEYFLPNPQVPSILAGSASLRLNSDKLVVLK